ncbi:MAG TPA: protein translocase subunit SecF [Gemmatimonadaceae bacterium]
MLRILHDTKYDFIGAWKAAVIGTVLWILIGFGGMLYHGGAHWSTEFTGGTLIQLQFEQPTEIARIRQAVEQASFQGAEIQQFGSSRDFTVKAPPREGDTSGETTAKQVEGALAKTFGAGMKVVRSEFVGPKVGDELTRNAVIAILISFLVTLVYLAFRFEWRFGLAAILSSLHDILATFAFIGLFRVEISLTVVAAILTVLGYSMNDTIIIFDRVRENLRKQRKEGFREILNRSINETLPRSVLTHVTTAGATIALLIFGGEVIRPFAMVMTFGIVMGTFSSIYVAGILLLWIETRWPRKDAEKGTARALAAEKRRAAEPRQPATTR